MSKMAFLGTLDVLYLTHRVFGGREDEFDKSSIARHISNRSHWRSIIYKIPFLATFGVCVVNYRVFRLGEHKFDTNSVARHRSNR